MQPCNPTRLLSHAVINAIGLLSGADRHWVRPGGSIFDTVPMMEPICTGLLLTYHKAVVGPAAVAAHPISESDTGPVSSRIVGGMPLPMKLKPECLLLCASCVWEQSTSP